jgi:hypothetical protein
MVTLDPSFLVNVSSTIETVKFSKSCLWMLRGRLNTGVSWRHFSHRCGKANKEDTVCEGVSLLVL